MLLKSNPLPGHKNNLFENRYIFIVQCEAFFAAVVTISSQTRRKLLVFLVVYLYQPSGAEIFRTRPDWPWGPPNLLCKMCRVFPGGKTAEGGADRPSPSNAGVKEKVELCLCFPSGPPSPVLGRTSPFLPKNITQ
jgi:hypothetical protein